MNKNKVVLCFSGIKIKISIFTRIKKKKVTYKRTLITHGNEQTTLIKYNSNCIKNSFNFLSHSHNAFSSENEIT